VSTEQPGVGTVYVHVYGMWELTYLKRNLDIRGVWAGPDPDKPGNHLVRVLEVGDGGEGWRPFHSKGLTFSLPRSRAAMIDRTRPDPGMTPYTDEANVLLANSPTPLRRNNQDGGKLDPGSTFSGGATDDPA